ncbi:NADH:flavin oxidoreductase/NADH oxidase [Neisseria animalis]|uniref:NADH:flavin oxidoreductase/NADH oxidase n=1 Tax=Neisseria animalis TaxID=492 RepID=A0A5P3MQD6_NEIAN|nr:NADH:flavin oxidoreductase/NADH oxidase [Neisseria animalis]QEY23807.1 NADH:flavin oxidoreductase/NADH oxidase [Neisseria animalis]ROW31587.1 NADH:flavin oxidoreductase/NADH oxidase [Neisseria animalis]VEE09766.1 FMN oxidoreductase CC3083 [Neisseria animalis]
MAKLRFLNTPCTIKNLELKNRVVMPPMCQYQAQDGMPNDWHFVHYTARAVGGAGLIIVEMTNVAPNGRITPKCLGLWNDEQRDALKKIVDSVHRYGSKIAVQIGHAGRKGLGHDHVVAPSPIAYENGEEAGAWQFQTPKDISTEEVRALVQAFQNAVKRAVEAGFDAVEIHGAHGYLIHQFHAPRTNKRTDEYGQDKMLFGEQVIKAAKAVMPSAMPLIVRISAQEYAEGGYDLDYGLEIAKRYAAAGADVMHVSGGGDGKLHPDHTPVFSAGYQVPFARAVKQATGLPTIAVGMLDDAAVADFVLANGDADLVAVGRGMLRDPHWLLNAQYNRYAADAAPVQFVPASYERAYL